MQCVKISKWLFFLIIMVSLLDVYGQNVKGCDESLPSLSAIKNRVETIATPENFDIRVKKILSEISVASDDAEKVQSYIYIAHLYLERNTDSVSLFLQKAEKMYEANPDIHSPDLLYRFCRLYYNMGEWDSALTNAFQGLETLDNHKVDEENAQSRIRFYYQIALIFGKIEDNKNSIEYINKAEKLLAEFPNPNMSSVLLVLKGWIAEKRPELFSENPMEIYEKAKQYSLTYKVESISFTTMVNKSVLYYKENNICEAVRELNEALSLEKITDIRMLLAAYSTIGEIFFTNGQPNAAIEYLEFTQEAAEKYGVQEASMHTNELLYQLYKEKNPAKALKHLELFNSIKESRSGYELKKALGEMEIKYKSSEKDKELIAKNLQLEKQKNKQIHYISVAVFILLCLIVLLFALRKKHSNKIQLLTKEQEISNLKAMIQGEEKERNRMAADLHDGIGAMVAAAQLNIDVILEHNPKVKQLDDLRIHLDKTAKEIRSLSHNLLPHVLQNNGLRDALYLYCNQIMATSDLEIYIQYDEHIPEFGENVKLILYRIFQELLQNTLKHAEATQVFIQVRQRNEKLLIFVEDNGKGFNPNKVNLGLGIHNIRLRVKALMGKLEILSNDGFGSTFSINFDISKLTKYQNL